MKQPLDFEGVKRRWRVRVTGASRAIIRLRKQDAKPEE